MNLFQDITYSHEHMCIDLSKQKNDLDCKLDCFDETVLEVKGLKEKGVKNIVDVTNIGMGRKVEYILKVSKETGVNIICSTGYYKEPFLPNEVYNLSEKELSKIMIKEIMYGIDESEIKANVIGEVGTSKDVIKEVEKKVLSSSARCHIETGKPIITHTTLGTMGLEQIEIFKEFNVDLDKVIISHVALSNDLDYILSLIDKGANVAFDTIGKIKYLSDETRVGFIKELCNRGLSQKVLMSMDITRKSHFRNRGGVGYSYLIDKFIPKLMEDGVSKKDIENMIKNNSSRIFDIDK